MKKLVMLAALAAVLTVMTGCGSLRTPAKGPNSQKVWYHTFFGLSIESALYGDGVVIVNQ